MAAELRGTVLESDSGAPIQAATVRLMVGDELVDETLTRQHGEFNFKEVAKGRNRIIAQKDGYLDLLAPTSKGRSIVLSESDQPLIELKLTRACAISGRVFDFSGQPARNMKVLALARRSVNGTVRLVQEGPAAFSDDRGGYRVYGIAPGNYTAAVVPEGEQVGSVSFTAVYFPGVADATQAEFFALRPGDTREGLDLSLVAVSSSRIAGIVTGIPTDWRGQRTALSIFSDGGWPIETVHADAEGHFSFHHIPPGSYQIVAWGPIFGWGDKGPVAGPNGRQGSRRVEVGATDVNDVEIELRNVGTVEGRVAFESAPAEGVNCYADGQLSLQPVDAMPEAVVLNAELSRGGFVIQDVPAGRFRLKTRSLKGDCYLKEVRVDGRKAAGGVVNVDGDTRLTLILGTSTGAVSGTVVGPDGKPPATGSMVILIGVAEGDTALEGPRIAPVDGEGHFRIEQIPPGFYEVLALSKLDSSDYLDPAFWDKYGGVRASVPHGSLIGINLRIAR